MDARLQFLKIEGLCNIVVCTKFQPLDDIFGAIQRRDHDDRHIGAAANFCTDLEAVPLWHQYVQHNQVKALRAKLFDRIVAVHRLDGGKAQSLHRLLEQPAHDQFIFRNQHAQPAPGQKSAGHISAFFWVCEGGIILA